MAFPLTPLGTKLEMQINGTWTNVVRYDSNTKILNKEGIQIVRGIGGLQDKTPPSTCKWTWEDPNGIYNNENPRSPYYGVLPRNTPVRVYVPRTDTALYCRTGATGDGSTDGVRCQTPDSAALSITGDIDIRIEFEPIMWSRFGIRAFSSGIFNSSLALCSKYLASPQRGWYVRILETGALGWGFSTTGSNAGSSSATIPIDLSSPRTAVRVTMDVDNGAGQSDITFYQAPNISGPWTVIGSVAHNAVVTLFDNTAPVELGGLNNGGIFATSPQFFGFRGRIYKFEMRNGIGGTVVASPDFTTQANGTTSFNDAQGNTWTVGSSAEITNAEYRFHGEFSAPVLKPIKSKSGAGVDIQIEGEAGGIIRRLQVNDAPLQSPLLRLFTSSTYTGPSGTSVNGYWAGEDAASSDTTSASSGTTGVNPAVLADVTFNGPDATLPGSAGVMVCGSTAPTFLGTCRATAQTTELHFVGMFKFPALPTGETTIFTLNTVGSVVTKWVFTADGTGYNTRGYNSAGTETVTKSTTYGTGAEPNKWIAFHLQLTNSAGTVNIKPEWMEMNSGLLYSQSGIGTVSFAGTPGVISSIVVAPSITTGGSGMRFAHLNASTLVGLIFWDSVNPTFAKIATGWRGESAVARFVRICQLIGVRPVIYGQLTSANSLDAGSELMGAEPLDTALNVLYECPSVDGGMIIEAVDQPNALEYWTRNAIENQFGTLALTWANLSEGLQATPDDTDVANDITLTRVNGGSAHVTQFYGPMSVQAPPNGINTVPDGPKINNYQDSRIPDLANYLLLKRTWPTSRYPSVVIQMERADFVGNSTLFLLAQRQMQAMRLQINTLPSFMAPETIDLLTRGITEQLQSQQWKITYACVPYGPYLGTELGTTAPLDTQFSYKAASTVVAGVTQQQLNAGITSGATSFAVKTLSGVLFDTTATNIPVMIDGELMTVGSVSGSTSPQTFNSVTRGVNGFSKAHNANAAVTVYPVLRARL